MNQLPKQRNPYLATDIIINMADGIVLIKRKNFPVGLAVPGGFAEWGLSLEDNAIKEAKEETNLDIENLVIRKVLSDPNRDPRGHVVTVVFTATVKNGSAPLKAGDDAKEAWLYSIDEAKKAIVNGELVFDHGKYLADYINLIEYRIKLETELFVLPSAKERAHNLEIMATAPCILCQQNPCGAGCSAKLSQGKRGIAGKMLTELMKNQTTDI